MPQTPDPYTLTLHSTTYSLGIDEEHGVFYARWSCPLCQDSGISEKTCSSETQALTEARYRAQLHHNKKHRPKKSHPH